MRNKTMQDNAMLTRLFFKLLPVQIMVVAMGSINSIVDGVVAGRFVSAEAVGVIGLYYSMVNILSAVGSVLLGGTSVLCCKYMGSGSMEKTNGIFSLNITVTLLIGAGMTAVSFLFPGMIADFLGADALLRDSLRIYVVGYAIGLVPQLLAQQIAAFLQLERQSARCYAGIVGMIASNVFFNVFFTAGLNMGIWGLALATALSNWVYFLILVPYYFGRKVQLRYHIRAVLWRELPELLLIGLPGAVLVFCIAVRSLFINRILLTYAGQDGLSAMSAFNMVCGLFIAFCLGTGSVVRMLTSIFMGEKDRDSIKAVMGIALTKGLALSVAVAAVVVAVSGLLAGVFFPDSASNVYVLTRQIFVIYGFCIPLVLICNVMSNYLQANGQAAFVAVHSAFDGLPSMLIPAFLLAPHMGAMGVWLSNPIGILLTILLVPVYGCIYWKRWPGTVDEWLFLKPSFGAADTDRMELSIDRLSDVTKTAVQVQAFCLAHGTSRRVAHFAALCLEEMAGNVVKHGFSADRKPHKVNCRVVCTGREILLRIKDDCIPFNPREFADMISPEDPFRNIGIRMIYRLADEVTYQNLLGLNVLSIRLTDEAHEERSPENVTDKQ